MKKKPSSCDFDVYIAFFKLITCDYGSTFLNVYTHVKRYTINQPLWNFSPTNCNTKGSLPSYEGVKTKKTMDDYYPDEKYSER